MDGRLLQSLIPPASFTPMKSIETSHNIQMDRGALSINEERQLAPPHSRAYLHLSNGTSNQQTQQAKDERNLILYRPPVAVFLRASSACW